MLAYYLTFSYPDGHVEEIEQSFSSRKDAIEYGLSLLNQVRATEETKREGFDYEGREPFFTVYEVDGDSRKLVFHSLELK